MAILPLFYLDLIQNFETVAMQMVHSTCFFIYLIFQKMKSNKKRKKGKIGVKKCNMTWKKIKKKNLIMFVPP